MKIVPNKSTVIFFCQEKHVSIGVGSEVLVQTS